VTYVQSIAITQKAICGFASCSMTDAAPTKPHKHISIDKTATNVSNEDDDP
jgi:hypothetical protein